MFGKPSRKVRHPVVRFRGKFLCTSKGVRADRGSIDEHLIRREPVCIFSSEGVGRIPTRGKVRASPSLQGTMDSFHMNRVIWGAPDGVGQQAIHNALDNLVTNPAGEDPVMAAAYETVARDLLWKQFMSYRLADGDSWYFLHLNRAKEAGFRDPCMEFVIGDWFRKDSEISKAASLFKGATGEQLKSCSPTEVAKGQKKPDAQMAEFLEKLGEVVAPAPIAQDNPFARYAYKEDADARSLDHEGHLGEKRVDPTDSPGGARERTAHWEERDRKMKAAEEQSAATLHATHAELFTGEDIIDFPDPRDGEGVRDGAGEKKQEKKDIVTYWEKNQSYPQAIKDMKLQRLRELAPQVAFGNVQVHTRNMPVTPRTPGFIYHEDHHLWEWHWLSEAGAYKTVGDLLAGLSFTMLRPAIVAGTPPTDDCFRLVNRGGSPYGVRQTWKMEEITARHEAPVKYLQLDLVQDGTHYPIAHDTRLADLYKMTEKDRWMFEHRDADGGNARTHQSAE